MSDKLQFVDWFGSDKLKLTGQLFPTFDATVALHQNVLPVPKELWWEKRMMGNRGMGKG